MQVNIPYPFKLIGELVYLSGSPLGNGYHVHIEEADNIPSSSNWASILTHKSGVKFKSIHHQWGNKGQPQGQLSDEHHAWFKAMMLPL